MNIIRAQEILKHQFGYDSFRMNQQPAIEAVLAQKDCVVLMPTGGGKSLCYQIPALLLDGLRVRDAGEISGSSASLVTDLLPANSDRIEILRGSGSSLFRVLWAPTP